MSWQAPGSGTGTGRDDPFSAVEAEIRAMAALPWWHTATPPQRAEAIASHMLSGAAEWWLFGAWGRWYRCGLDGHWHMCPPPADPAARQMAGSARSGTGTPPVPSPLFPVGPDLAAGRVASIAFLGRPPETAVVARLQQALITALSVNPAQFALRDNAFPPGTPSTVAAAWGALLWCAGSPVALAEHPLIELFLPYLTIPSHMLRWMVPPDMAHLVRYYTDRLGAGDGVGAAHLVRVMHEVAAGLRGDSRFRPGADALAAVTAATLPMVRHDMAAARFGPVTIIQEWRRRCPAEYATSMLRDGAPGEYLRLGLYDLAETVIGLHERPSNQIDVRHAGVAVLAADLQRVPNAVPAVLPWLDPDAARTLQMVLAQPDHPLRELWPSDGRLPAVLRSDEAGQIQTLLATSYTVALAACRLAQTAPPAPGFAMPAAAAAELTGPALRIPKSTGDLTPWQIIEAARAHLAAERSAQHAQPEPLVPPPPTPQAGPPHSPSRTGPHGLGPPVAPPEPPRAKAPVPYPPVSPQPPVPGTHTAQAEQTGISAEAPAASVIPPPFPPGPPPQGQPPREPGVAAPDVGALIVAAYGTRFLCGPDDIDRLLTEVRRRGKWARRLRGQEVSNASAPALLLLGALSSGQRRLTRMIARALADVDVSSGEVHTLHAGDLRERDPEGVSAAIEEHAGHTLLLERLDALTLDEPDGPAYAAALYRARVEGVSDTTLVATCGADRMARLSAAYPALVTDFRAIRLPDLSDPAPRVALLGLLADERRVSLSATAWDLARQDLTRLRGRGRFTNARIVAAYLDRACANHLGRVGETQVTGGRGALVLTPTDLQGIVEDLPA